MSKSISLASAMISRYGAKGAGVILVENGALQWNGVRAEDNDGTLKLQQSKVTCYKR